MTNIFYIAIKRSYVHFLIPNFQILLIHINKVGNRINKVGHETTKWVNESTKWVNESTSWTAPNQPGGQRQLYANSYHVVPKLSQSFTKVVPKLRLSCPNVVPKLSLSRQICLKVLPKSPESGIIQGLKRTLSVCGIHPVLNL